MISRSLLQQAQQNAQGIPQVTVSSSKSTSNQQSTSNQAVSTSTANNPQNSDAARTNSINELTLTLAQNISNNRALNGNNTTSNNAAQLFSNLTTNNINMEIFDQLQQISSNKAALDSKYSTLQNVINQYPANQGGNAGRGFGGLKIRLECKEIKSLESYLYLTFFS